MCATNTNFVRRFEESAAEDCDVIVTNQNLYVEDDADGWIVKVSSGVFTNHIGDVLITDSGYYRVLAAYSNTVVTITGKVVHVSSEPMYGPWTVTTSNITVVVTITNAGQFYETNIDGPVVFRANHPIQVAQFANGGYFDQTDSSSESGDPCEILLPPTGYYLMTNTVVAFTNDLPNQAVGDFDKNYLNLIVPQSATNSTWVDGWLVTASNYVAVGTSGYYGEQITITNSGTHTVTSSQPVGVEVYGWGHWDAYGYFGGAVK